MKISKSEIKYLIQIILIWSFINVTLNVLGLWFTKLLKPAEFIFLESISNELVKPMIFQSLIFGICISVAYKFMKNKKLALYSFVALQFVAFHIIFLLNIKVHHGIHFVSTFNNPGLKYLSYSGQYLVDILYLYFPINGNFENGIFMPDKIGTFYIHWILLIIVYYFGLTWMAIKAVKFIFKPKTARKSKVKIENEPEVETRLEE